MLFSAGVLEDVVVVFPRTVSCAWLLSTPVCVPSKSDIVRPTSVPARGLRT